MTILNRRKKYQVFTPSDTVIKILNEIGYFGESIIDKSFIDISCGNGAFLTEALKRYIDVCDNKKYSTEKTKTLIESHFYGCENDKLFFNQCLINMQNIINEEYGDALKVNFKNIKCVDGLLLKNKKFDFVLGNPPYLSYKEMSQKQRCFLKENFYTCKEYKFDYSYAFIEKSINICKKNGNVAIISPINMYRIKSGRLMREFVRNKLYKVIDVTEDKIFPGVLTNPVISFFKSENKNEMIEFNKNDSKTSISIDSFYNNDFENLVISSGKNRFGDFYSVHNGVATLLNSAFIVPKDADIEEEILKNACSPKGVRYNTNDRIIFPYIIDGERIKRIDELFFKNNYPKAYKHLSSLRNELNNRKISNGIKWFEYGRTQALDNVLYKKIMIPAIFSDNINPVMLGENDVVYAGFYILEKDPINHPLEKLPKMLKSKNFFNYIKSVGVKMNGKTYRYSVKDLENYRY